MRISPRTVEALALGACALLSACAHVHSRAGSDGPQIPDSAVSAGSSVRGRTLEDVFVGKFPGLEVMRLPAGGITFRIRGVDTILGSGEPLIIVDGAELLNGGGGLQFLSGDDIVRVEVLKDVGSTGAYGMRGANGVILITTRRPP